MEMFLLGMAMGFAFWGGVLENIYLSLAGIMCALLLIAYMLQNKE